MGDNVDLEAFHLIGYFKIVYLLLLAQMCSCRVYINTHFLLFPSVLFPLKLIEAVFL